MHSSSRKLNFPKGPQGPEKAQILNPEPQTLNLRSEVVLQDCSSAKVPSDRLPGPPMPPDIPPLLSVHESCSRNSSKGVIYGIIQGSARGVIQEDTRSLDYSSDTPQTNMEAERDTTKTTGPGKRYHRNFDACLRGGSHAKPPQFWGGSSLNPKPQKYVKQ